MKRAPLIVILFMAASTVSAAAQTPDPVSEAPIRIGVLGLSPRVSVTNIGVDTNVFNSATNPESAFTVTTSPGLNVWLRTGRGLLSIDGQIDSVYYAKYSGQGSFNSTATGLYEFRLNRLRPWASFRVLDTKQRPGFEIDIRARRFEDDVRAGLEVRVASKSHISLSYRAQGVVYGGGEEYRGQTLNRALNRTQAGVDLTWRQRLTALTTVLVTASREEERFEFATERNSNSGRVTVGVELGQFALIRGNATVGFRSLAAADGGTVPSFQGITADAEVSYTAPTQTRVNLTTFRDVQYSYDLANPYYLQTGLGLSLTQRVIGRWDVQANAGRDQLAYRGATPANGASRRDYVDHVGGGVGYQLGEKARLGFNVVQDHRQSRSAGNNYRGLRAGASITYVY